MRNTKKPNKKILRPKNLKKCAMTVSCGALFILCAATPVFATTSAESIINSGFDNLKSIVSAIVTAVGAIILLWGLFEWGVSFQSTDGVQQSNSFKRIGGGIVMVLAPQLLNLFITS